MAGSAPAAQRAAVKRATRMSRAWWRDRVEFDELVEGALADGDDAALACLLDRARPNDFAAIDLAVSRAAETIRAADGRWARLVAIPAVVDPAYGLVPDTEAISEALLTCGNLPPRSGVAILNAYLDPAGVGDLAPCGVRKLLDFVLNGGSDRPSRADMADASSSPHGVRVVVVGAILVEDPDHVTLIDDDEPGSGDMNLRRLLISLLRAGSGIVDVAPPMPLFSLNADFEEAAPWLVARSGASAELASFFSVAAASVGEDRLDCEMRPVVTPRGGVFSLRLNLPSGAMVDSMEVDPYDLPMSPHEFRRTAEGLSRSFSFLQALPSPVMGVPMPRTPVSRPAFRTITGGRDAREAEDRDTWAAGIRKKMADLRKPVGVAD